MKTSASSGRLTILFSLWFICTPPSRAGQGTQAAVASAHPLATEAGAEVLAAGGNAFDAAVAVSAALAVVEPYAPGLGGGGFWLLHHARDGKQVFLDGRETAPLGASRDMYVKSIPGASTNGALSAAIPGFAAVPLERLLSKSYARARRRGIDLAKATPSRLATKPASGSGNTTHFSIIDCEGNRVAATLSINNWFGSGYMVPGTGVLLNDEMDDFSVSPGVPNMYGLVGGEANEIAPRKRPLSSMTPTFLEDRDRFAIVGTPGGSRIISLVLLAVLDFAAGRPLATWVARPRFHHQYLPDRIEYEPFALTPNERAGLAAARPRADAFNAPLREHAGDFRGHHRTYCSRGQRSARRGDSARTAPPMRT